MSVLGPVLSTLSTIVDSAIAGTEAQIQPLTEEGVAVFNSVVVPKLDVPGFLQPLITGAESKVTAPLDSLATAELELLRKRLDSLL